MSTIGSPRNLQQLIQGLESKSTSLLTSIDFYRLGLVIHNDPDRSSAVIAAYKDYLDAIPFSYSQNVMKELSQAFRSIISNAGSTLQDIRNASLSISSLCVNSNRACLAAFSLDLCITLASAYNRLSSRQEENEAEIAALRKALDCLLVDGLLQSIKDTPKERAIQSTMELVDALMGDDKCSFLGDTLVHSNGSFVEKLSSAFEDYPDERDYLLRILESSSTSSGVAKNQLESIHASNSAAMPMGKVDPQVEIQRRIQQVKDVLPDLGPGYIESVLSYFGGDVPSSLAALLDPSSLPSALQLLDTKLPARRKEALKSTAYELDDLDAKQIAKERFAALERQQELEAYALTVVHNEYDDDYDDQYDELDVDGDLGGKGSTYDEVDHAHIKIYNRVIREAERDDAFWEQSRNTNHDRRKQPVATSKDSSQLERHDDDSASQKVYRGADKIKGGRLLGPDGKVLPRQRGDSRSANPPNGHGEHTIPEQKGKQGISDEMSKLQKRRKNDNKAKLGNHHRKDRAQKKQSVAGS